MTNPQIALQNESEKEQKEHKLFDCFTHILELEVYELLLLAAVEQQQKHDQIVECPS